MGQFYWPTRPPFSSLRPRRSTQTGGPEMPPSPDPIQALGRLLGRLLPISLAEVLERAPHEPMVGRLA